MKFDILLTNDVRLVHYFFLERLLYVGVEERVNVLFSFYASKKEASLLSCNLTQFDS